MAGRGVCALFSVEFVCTVLLVVLCVDDNCLTRNPPVGHTTPLSPNLDFPLTLAPRLTDLFVIVVDLSLVFQKKLFRISRRRQPRRDRTQETMLCRMLNGHRMTQENITPVHMTHTRTASHQRTIHHVSVFV